MSAELLREAAALMRSRAEAATSGCTECDMGYIASWHPAVALAVADWLCDLTACCDECIADPSAQTHDQASAIKIAAAYLGRDK